MTEDELFEQRVDHWRYYHRSAPTSASNDVMLFLERLERVTRERDEARAELSTLRKDYDSVLEANVGLLDDAPWADVRRAYIRGAEAMREACAREAAVCANHRGEELDAILSALPIAEEP